MFGAVSCRGKCSWSSVIRLIDSQCCSITSKTLMPEAGNTANQLQSLLRYSDTHQVNTSHKKIISRSEGLQEMGLAEKSSSLIYCGYTYNLRNVKAISRPGKQTILRLVASGSEPSFRLVFTLTPSGHI